MRLKFNLVVAAIITSSPLVGAQTIKPLSITQGAPPKEYQLTYRGTTLDQVLEIVRKITGRTYIMDPKVSPITINLVSETKLSETDVLIAIETVLEMNNIVMIPQGDKFLQIVPADSAFQRPLDTNFGAVKDLGDDESRLISQVIELKYVTLEEVQPILQLMLHPFAKVQALERANAIMLTDSAYNIKRVIDALTYIDRPNLRSEEPKIYQIKYAVSTEVAAKLTELIAESQAEAQQRSAGTLRTPTSTPTTTRTAPAGVIRARTPTTPAATSASFNLESSNAEKGLVTGKVQIVPDERTNIIIVISRPENFAFFDQMIEVLDVKVEPEITFKNIRLEFAIAEDIASLINELIGAASAGDSRGSGATPAAGSNAAANTGSTQARSIRDFIQSRNQSSGNTAASSNAGRSNSDAGNLGEISETTQVIADPRTNSIMIMGRKRDIALLSEVIKEVDIMLDQVLIEAVILEVSLNNNISYGVDWLQRSLKVVNQQQAGPRGGITTTDDIAAFGTASRQNGGSFIDGATVDRTTEFADGALSIFGTYYDLNLDVVLTLAAGDSDARVLSTPVILTTDNTEANIIVGERRPIPTSTSSGINTGVNQTNVDYENIGIELKVTPRINPQGFVVMEIEQSADNVGGNVLISGDEFPIITTRQLQGSIAVQDRQTIVLGGLVSEDTRDSTTKVPLVGDLPLIGSLFRSQRNENNRTELLVLITPYVIGSSIDADSETRRLEAATKISDKSWHRQWSDSPHNPDKNAEVPISRFRDKLPFLKNDEQADGAEVAPTFAPVNASEDLPEAKQVVETSRFKRPLLQKPETVAAEEVKGVWNIKPGPGDQTKTTAPVEKVPEYKVPDKQTPPAPTVPAAVPEVNVVPPVVEEPIPSVPNATGVPAVPASEAPGAVLPVPVLPDAPPPVSKLPEPVKKLPPNTISKVRPTMPAAPAIAPPSPKVVEPVKASPVDSLRANPAVKLVSPAVPKAEPVAPPNALKQQSGQRLILNSGAAPKVPAAWDKEKKNAEGKDGTPKVGDELPGKDDTSQNKSSGWRGLFGSLR